LLNQTEGGGDIRSKCRAISRSHPCSRKSFSASRNALSWLEWDRLVVSPSMVHTKINFSAILTRPLDEVARYFSRRATVVCVPRGREKINRPSREPHNGQPPLHSGFDPRLGKHSGAALALPPDQDKCWRRSPATQHARRGSFVLRPPGAMRSTTSADGDQLRPHRLQKEAAW
jgi:hypothetical protein